MKTKPVMTTGYLGNCYKAHVFNARHMSETSSRRNVDEMIYNIIQLVPVKTEISIHHYVRPLILELISLERLCLPMVLGGV